MSDVLLAPGSPAASLLVTGGRLAPSSTGIATGVAEAAACYVAAWKRRAVCACAANRHYKIVTSKRFKRNLDDGFRARSLQDGTFGQ
ncbi:uncharacterized protein LOC112493767 isoform X2 [Cephus cinctus]|uniref:Uncharacterized protein LOC112493767 isoform X2 n=1 Tax=Cephus cinctus TaxID=211228 RepID=A0AAJ7R9L5_CEPCN|nr:uncharacterized protein LOC112493767 isoform X2 [Cephus cinctus]